LPSTVDSFSIHNESQNKVIIVLRREQGMRPGACERGAPIAANKEDYCKVISLGARRP